MLAVLRASALPRRPEERRWLVENLWSAGAVGIVGGEPKCFKSYLSLEIAVAVASGRPCLRRFAVTQPGRVLLFAAEDDLWEVRRRLEGITTAVGLSLEAMDIQVITVPVVRLDLPRDRDALEQTVSTLKPRLLILDPFVRLHRVDENVVAEVAPLLAFLRMLQRKYQAAVLLVHHARKGGAHLRAGQALRGSSELHAWGDSNLYLRRKGTGVCLTVEHRNAPSATGLALELVTRNEATALEIVERVPEEEKPVAVSSTERIRTALQGVNAPITVRQIRSACKMRTETVCELLAQLVKQGQVTRIGTGYQLAKNYKRDIRAVPHVS